MKDVDVLGREAFAYLAVVLLVTTTFAVAYTAYSKRRGEQDLASVQILDTFRVLADSEEGDLRAVIMDVNSRTIDGIATDPVAGSGLDALAEVLLRAPLVEGISASLVEFNGSAEGCNASLVGLSIDCTPLLASVPGPVPEPHDPGVNGTGCTNYTDICEVLGVESMITAAVRFEGEGIAMDRNISVSTQRRSLGQLSAARVSRAASELENGELHRVAGYLLSSYAQQKVLSGDGRGTYDSYEGPIVSEEEAASIIDLAVESVASAHLLDRDEGFLDGTTEALQDLPVSGGCALSLSSLLNGSTGPIDAFSALIGTTGMMSEGNEPDLSELVRPIFEYVMDLLVNRFVSYIGLDGQAVQDIITSIDDAQRAIAEGIVSVLGIEVRERGEKDAYDMFLNLLNGSGIDVSDGLVLMKRDYGGLLYEGSRLSSYPVISPSPIHATFAVLTSDYDPGHVLYRDAYGGVHPGTETRPGDRYWGHVCHRYEFEARFSLDGFECPLEEVDVSGPDLEEGLLKAMGELRSKVRTLLDEAESIVWGAIEDLLSRLGSEGIQLFKGWNATDPPSLTGDTPPSLASLAKVRGAVDSFLEILSAELPDSFDLSSFGTSLARYERSIGGSLARWLNDTYNELVGVAGLTRDSLQRALDRFFGGCTIEVSSVIMEGTEIADRSQAVFPPGGIDDVGHLRGNRELLLEWGLNRTDLSEDILVPDLLVGISEAVSEMRSREAGEDGILTAALTDQGTRGGGMLQSVFDQGSEKVKALLRDHVLPVLDAIERDITRGYDLAGMRALLPATDDIDGTIEPRDWVDGNVSFGTIHADFSLTALGRSQTVVHYGRGVRETDPGSSDVPYETFVTVNHSRTYRMGYSLTGASYPSNSTSSKDVVVILDLLVPMAGTYALDGCDYDGTMTAWDRISNTGAYMTERAIETIANGSTGMLGGSLSSLSELPPLITDLVKGKDLDLSTAASVLSNLTMDISSSLREAAKELISSLVDGAISWSLDKLMELLDVEVLHAELRTGPLKLDLTSDTKALDGEDGRILVLIADVPTLGMHGSFGITRNGTKVLFNGTVEIEKGPLYLRLEIDPFMEVRDSIISIGGTYHGPEEDLRISVKAPEKVEYRSAEITLESILGMEPNVFIAPIGTSVFFNAGFRMRYQTPDELSPRINEIEFTDANLSRLEIFNPGKYQLSGCTLDLAPPNGPAYGIHSLDLITRGRYALLSVNHTTVKMWERSVDPARPLIVLVRDPSGMVMDRITVKGPWVGWYSRDADGYGVFRWGNGTPGWSNGGMASFSFSGLLIQLVRSSLEEAWTEVVGEYGLSFDSIVRFVQEAMDHFVERVCSAVAELIVDVRMFISMKIAAGTGASAGFGAELAFIAEGEAVAEFIGWLYENIKVLIAKMFDPQGAGDFRTFPMTILEKCHIEAMVYSEVDTPKALSKLASKGKEFPTTLTLAVAGRVNMALPFRLMGKDIGAWKVSAGIFIMDAPRELVTLLYDVGSAETTIELWLLHISVWSEPRLSQLSG